MHRLMNGKDFPQIKNHFSGISDSGSSVEKMDARVMPTDDFGMNDDAIEIAMRDRMDPQL